MQGGCLLLGPSFSVPNSPEFSLTQETLNRLVPPDGKGHWYSGYLAVSGGSKGRYLEVFGYIVDRQEVDKEDEGENNRVCIFRVACLGVEEESDSLCLSLKEICQWRKQMSTSYLMIPEGCDQTGRGSVCLCVHIVPILCESVWVHALRVFLCTVFVVKTEHGSFSPKDHPCYHKCAL